MFCFVFVFVIFFFKQKTAYEMLRSLVGSEMCIRDRVYSVKFGNALSPGVSPTARGVFMLPGGYNEKVLDMPVPDGCAGSYKAIVGLADAGRKVVGVESAFASDMAEFTAR